MWLCSLLNNKLKKWWFKTKQIKINKCLQLSDETEKFRTHQTNSSRPWIKQIAQRSLSEATSALFSFFLHHHNHHRHHSRLSICSDLCPLTSVGGAAVIASLSQTMRRITATTRRSQTKPSFVPLRNTSVDAEIDGVEACVTFLFLDLNFSLSESFWKQSRLHTKPIITAEKYPSTPAVCSVWYRDQNMFS